MRGQGIFTVVLFMMGVAGPALASAPQRPTILGLEVEPPLRAPTMRLSHLSGVPFQEGFLPIPRSTHNPAGRSASIAWAPPVSETAPIFVFTHGATQDKTSFAAMALSLRAQNENVGMMIPDIYGAGETLEKHLPMTYDVPIEHNSALLKTLVERIRAHHPTNPIVLVGVSYGMAVTFIAFREHPELYSMVSSVVGVSFGPENDQSRGEILLRGGLLKALWPNVDTSEKVFQNLVLQEVVYTRSMFFEPAVLKPPYPWTLRALVKLAEGVDEPDLSPIERAMPEGFLNIVLSTEERYLDIKKLSAYYSRWPATRSVVLLKDSDHKANQSNPNFLASWLLQVANQDPEQGRPRGLFLGHPKEGFAEPLCCDAPRVDLHKDHWPKLNNSLWLHEYQQAILSWFQPHVWTSQAVFNRWMSYFWIPAMDYFGLIAGEVPRPRTPVEAFELVHRKLLQMANPYGNPTVFEGIAAIREAMNRQIESMKPGPAWPHGSREDLGPTCELILKE